MLETMTASVIISMIDVHMYIVLSKAKKHMPYGELVDTSECKMLTYEVLHSSGLL
jgi:hypothetical protein